MIKRLIGSRNLARLDRDQTDSITNHLLIHGFYRCPVCGILLNGFASAKKSIKPFRIGMLLQNTQNSADFLYDRKLLPGSDCWRERAREIIAGGGCQLVSIHKWLFFAISASNCGITCATYLSTSPHNPLIFLILQKIPHSWIGNLLVPKFYSCMGNNYNIVQSDFMTWYRRGMKMAGSILPIFIFLMSSKLMPIAKMSSPPTADIWETTSGNK